MPQIIYGSDFFDKFISRLIEYNYPMKSLRFLECVEDQLELLDEVYLFRQPQSQLEYKLLEQFYQDQQQEPRLKRIAVIAQEYPPDQTYDIMANVMVRPTYGNGMAQWVFCIRKQYEDMAKQHRINLDNQSKFYDQLYRLWQVNKRHLKNAGELKQVNLRLIWDQMERMMKVRNQKLKSIRFLGNKDRYSISKHISSRLIELPDRVIIYYNRDKTKYEGGVLYGFPEGYGCLTKRNEVYRGYFQNGYYHGQGELCRRINGQEQLIYKGNFSNGFYNLAGELHEQYVDHILIYKGTFNKNRKHGVFDVVRVSKNQQQRQEYKLIYSYGREVQDSSGLKNINISDSFQIELKRFQNQSINNIEVNTLRGTNWLGEGVVDYFIKVSSFRSGFLGQRKCDVSFRQPDLDYPSFDNFVFPKFRRQQGQPQ